MQWDLETMERTFDENCVLQVEQIVSLNYLTFRHLGFVLL